MSGDEKGNLVTPTSTVLQARVRIFQPSQRPQMLTTKWIETAWGQCQIKGRLGQRHADVMESLLFCAERKRDINDGGVELLVDPAKVRKTLSDGRYSYEQIEKLLVELRTATITIHTPQFDFPIIGGLIDHVVPSPMTRYDPLTCGERNLWRVRLGIALVTLLNHDLSLYYQPAPVARLKHGVSQAVARHVLTHKSAPPTGWHLDTLIKAVCGESASSQEMRNGRRRIKEDAEKLAELGIYLDHQNRVKRATTAR